MSDLQYFLFLALVAIIAYRLDYKAFQRRNHR